MNVIYEYPVEGLGDEPSIGVISPLTKAALLGPPLCQYSYDIHSVVPEGVSTFRNFHVGGYPVTAAAVSNDQSQFAYANNVMTIIDSRSGREKRSNLIHDGAVRGICQFNKNPYCWLTTSDDRSLRSWDARDFPGEVKFPSKPLPKTRCVCMSPDDNVAIVGGELVTMYDVRTRRVLNELPMNSSVNEICVHFGEALLAVACEDRVVSFWDIDTLECVSQSSVCDSPVRRMQFIECQTSVLQSHSSPFHLLLVATDKRLSTFGYEPFEIHSFVPSYTKPDDFVTFDLRVDRSAGSPPRVTTLGYSADQGAWSVQQIDLEALLSASQLVDTTSESVEPSIVDDSESPLDTDELESPVNDDDLPISFKAPKDDFSIELLPASQPNSPVHRAAAAAQRATVPPNNPPKPPRPLARPRSAAPSVADKPRMTNRGRVATQGAEARVARKTDIKSRATTSAVGQRPPVPTSLQGSRSRATSKSSLQRNHSSGNVRRSSVQPAIHRRVSRSPSAPVTPAYLIQAACSGSEDIMTHLERRLKLMNSIIRTLQTRGLDEALAESIDTGDTSLLAEVLRKINGKPKLWTIALCSRIASHLRKILSERNELYVDAGLEALQTIITSFGDLLRQAAFTNPNDIGVNVAAEERQSRCVKCIEALREVRMNQPFLERRFSPERRLKFNALMEIFDSKIETLK
ncbi:hypothetical protein L596_010027 [Steinernema carpocapsae]|uniref:Katanin p80 subunit C-terminal domain-containing protein n=1 Tax=Steinernema carpocapsae TaxID=34508 RepID=A0A4U5PHW4_STECR|nr:hypothetical protein L596_010027 [Steinernema carpocapsae]